MKMITLIILLNIFTLMNCTANDDFSYDDYIFLEETEWYTAFDLFENGEARFLRFEKSVKLLQQEWWNGSYRIYLMTSEKNIKDLGYNAEFTLDYRDKNQRLIQKSLDENGNTGVIDRISDSIPNNKILGKWADMNKNIIHFEYREHPMNDYVYLFYIRGVYAIDLRDNSENPVSSWFLLTYEGNGVFTTDGAFDKDAFRLEIISENELRFIPEYESTGEYLRTKKIYAKGYDWVKDN